MIRTILAALAAVLSVSGWAHAQTAVGPVVMSSPQAVGVAQYRNEITVDGQTFVAERIADISPLHADDQETSGFIAGTDFPVLPNIIGVMSVTLPFAADDPKVRLVAGLQGEWGRLSAGVVAKYVDRACGLDDDSVRICSPAYSAFNANLSYDWGHGWETSVTAMNFSNDHHFDGVADYAEGGVANTGARWQVKVWKHW